MHELAAAIFAEFTSYGNGIFIAAQDNDIITLKGILKTLKEDPNKLDGEGRTALSISILSSADNATVTLLEFNADPNIPVKLHGYSQKKKIIQFCINNNDKSTIQLLGIYGTTTDGLIFPQGSAAEKNVFVEAIKKKQNLDRHLSQASLSLQSNFPNYSSALNDFQIAGDIWFEIAQGETKNVFKKHYFEKAFQNYQQAEQCFKSLPECLILLNRDKYRQLYARCADVAIQLNKNDKAVAYSQQAAQLTTTSFLPVTTKSSFPNSHRNTKPAEQQPLLSQSDCQTNPIDINKSRHLKSA